MSTAEMTPLAGTRPLVSARAAADDEDKKKKEEEARKAEEEDKKKKDEEARKAEEEDKKKKDEEEARAMAANAAAANAGRSAERARIRSILMSAEASKPDFNMPLAIDLATEPDSNMSPRAIVAIVGRSPLTKREAPQNLNERMANIQVPDVGAGDLVIEAPSTQAAAAMILAAGRKARGETV